MESLSLWVPSDKRFGQGVHPSSAFHTPSFDSTTSIADLKVCTVEFGAWWDQRADVVDNPHLDKVNAQGRNNEQTKYNNWIKNSMKTIDEKVWLQGAGMSHNLIRGPYRWNWSKIPRWVQQLIRNGRSDARRSWLYAYRDCFDHSLEKRYGGCEPGLQHVGVSVDLISMIFMKPQQKDVEPFLQHP